MRWRLRILGLIAGIRVIFFNFFHAFFYWISAWYNYINNDLFFFPFNMEINVWFRSSNIGNYSKIVWHALLKKFLDKYGEKWLYALWYRSNTINRMYSKWLSWYEIDVILSTLKWWLNLDYIMEEWEFNVFRRIWKFKWISVFFAIFYGAKNIPSGLEFMDKRWTYSYTMQFNTALLDKRRIFNAYLFFMIDIYKYTKVMSKKDVWRYLMRPMDAKVRVVREFVKFFSHANFISKKYGKLYRLRCPVWNGIKWDYFQYVMEEIFKQYNNHAIFNIQEHLKKQQGTIVWPWKNFVDATKQSHNPAIYHIRHYIPSLMNEDEQKFLRRLY